MVKEFLEFRKRNLGVIDYERKEYISPRTQGHYFRIHDGFGISVFILDYLDLKKIEKIIINFNGNIYETTVDDFITSGIDWEDSTFGKKEKQLILPMKYWNKKHKKEELQTALC